MLPGSSGGVLGVRRRRADVVFASSAVDTSNTTAYTFSGKSIGAAAANRKVVVAPYGGLQTKTVSALTIGGVSASLVKRQASGGGTVELWQAVVPTGATADIVVTWSGAQDRCGIGVWAIYGAVGAAYDTDGNTTAAAPAIELDIPYGGVAIAALGSADSVAARTFTWAGLTEDYDQTVESGGSKDSQSGASAAFTATQAALAIAATPSATPDTIVAMAGASWGPG